MQRTAPIHAMRNWVPLCSDEQHMGWPSSMLPHSSGQARVRLSWALNPGNVGRGDRMSVFKSIFCLWHRRIGASNAGRFVFASRVLSIPAEATAPPLDRCHRGYVQRRDGGAGHFRRQRQPAPYRGLFVIDCRRSHLGAYVLYRGQRHDPSDHWLAGQLHGAQAAVNDGGDRIHAVQRFVRACP